MRYLWASFNFLVHFLIIFFNVQSFKYEFLWKILDIQLYNIKFSLKIFEKNSEKKKIKIKSTRSKFLIYICDQNFMLVPTINLLELSDKNWDTYERLLIFWSIFWLFFSMSKVSNMNFYEKSLIYNYTTMYDIDFPRKIGFLRFFLRKFLLTVFHIFHRKYTPNFQKIDFSIYPNILYICDQNFMLVPTIKLLELSDKNWDTYERLLIFWSNFLIIFFNVRSFKYEFLWKILDIQLYNTVRHWFSTINWIFAIFFKKVSIDGFSHFSSKIHPKFSKNRLFHIPQYIIYLWSEFYARSNNPTIRIIG